MNEAALTIEHLVVDYSTARRRRGRHREPASPAVDDVSLTVGRGEFVGLVGESGAGKSSIVNAIMGLTRVTAGTVRVAGVELTCLSTREARRARLAAQLIMQDPYESLDPHMTVRRIVEEPLIVHKLERDKARRRQQVTAALEAVGLTPAPDFEQRHAHELSGGQRQRVAIAASLIVRPALLLADEPVSMLDVSVRAGILHTLDGLRHHRGAAVVMITHDLPTAAAFCDRLLVMQHGVVVEEGIADDVARHPTAQYTKTLLAATPTLSRDVQRA